VTAFAGDDPVKAKIIVDGKVIEYVTTFKYLSCDLSYSNNGDVEENLNRFCFSCGIIRCMRLYPKSFQTGHLEQELQMVQLSATRHSCITNL
jgi:hypothetical protein